MTISFLVMIGVYLVLGLFVGIISLQFFPYELEEFFLSKQEKFTKAKWKKALILRAIGWPILAIAILIIPIFIFLGKGIEKVLDFLYQNFSKPKE